MVGDILRRERERQKLSVKDIEQGTSIRSLYIESIENGDYDKLPGNVYTKGFIKNYGNFLKLDGDALSRQFTEEVAPSPPPIATEEVTSQKTSPKSKVAPTPADETAAIVAEPIPDINTTQRRSEPEIKINSPKLVNEKSNNGLILAAIVLIAVIAGGLWYYFTNIEGKEIAQNPPGQTQTQTETPSSTAVPASASTPDNTSSGNINGISLQAKFNDRCWTKVIVDGRTAYEGTAEAGQTLDWQAKERITVTAGNAGAVEFVENGKSLGIAGSVGDVVEKTFVRR